MRANNFKELVHFAQEQSIAAAFIARTKNSTQDDNDDDNCESQQFMPRARSKITNVPICVHLHTTCDKNVRLSKGITRRMKGMMHFKVKTQHAQQRKKQATA